MKFMFEKWVAERAVDMIIEEWEIKEEPCSFEEILGAFTKNLLDSPINFIQYNKKV